MASVEDIKALLLANNSLIKIDIESAKSDVLKSVKEDIEKAKKEVMEHVDVKLDEVKNDVDDLKLKVQVNDDEISNIKLAGDRERRSRNIVLFKIPEEENGARDLKFRVIKILSDNVKIDITNYFDKAYRIGKKDPTKIRPIIISLTSHDKKMEIFWNKKQLDSTLEISDDFSPETLEKRRKLVPILKTLKELGYNNVQLRQDKLYVDGNVCEEASWRKMIESDSQNPNADMQEDVGKTVDVVSSPIIQKRGREESESESSPSRSPKQIKESEKVILKSPKTTIVGSNIDAKNKFPKNPIREKLRLDMLNSTMKPS